MRLSNEVAAFLNIINVYFHPERQLDPSIFTKVNWKNFEKALEFHAIRPIVYDILKDSQIEVPNKLLKNLELFSTTQAVSHLSNTIELKRLESLFEKASIPMISFKGVAYQKALYTTGLREAGDMDLLISQDDLEDTLNLLLDDNYTYSLNIKGSPSDLTKNLLKAQEQYELPFHKNNFHIDLHWGIHYGFLPYHVPKDFIFSLRDNTHVIFWTMINHHGAKEFWLRLKGLVDLGNFIKRNRNLLDWAEIIKQAEEFKMKTVLLNGLYLLKHFIELELPQVIENYLKTHTYKALPKTRAYWALAANWSKPFERINFEQILTLSQDRGFSKWQYYKNIYLAYTKPNLAEQKRFLTFPERYHFLNFLSKVFSYLIKKTFGIK